MDELGMKKTIRFRTAAAVLYALLCVFQMCTMRFTLLSMQMGITLTSLTVPWLAELLLCVAAGAMAVWLIAHRRPVAGPLQRAAIMFTALVVIFELVSYEAQTEALRVAWMVTTGSQDAASGLLYGLLFARLALWIIGVFLLFCAGEGAFAKKADAADAAAEEAGDETDDKTAETAEAEGKEPGAALAAPEAAKPEAPEAPKAPEAAENTPAE